jgi:septum formation inhibitor MinC
MHDIFNDIRQSKAFYQNQSNLRECLHIAYECSLKLLSEYPEHKITLACTTTTNTMFNYYLSSCNAERAILALHLKFTDAVHHVKNDLASLLTENIEDLTLHQGSQTLLTQKRPEQVQSTMLESSTQELDTRWQALSTKQVQQTNIPKLLKLTKDVSQYVYHQKKHMPAAEKSHILTLGLAVEARYIEQLQNSNGPIRHISKGMQRAAKYFHDLSQHYQDTGMPELAEKMGEKNKLMSERAMNYARMLACRNVEQSKNTTTSEKKHAELRRHELKAEDPDNLDEICSQYKNICGGDETLATTTALAPIDHTSVNHARSELAMTAKQDTNVFFELYMQAQTYLNHVQYGLLAEIHYDKTIFDYDPLLQDEDDTMPSEVQAKLVALLQTEAGERLQGAVQFYYEVKCKYYDSIQESHNKDESVETERFQAAFQKQAYDLLLQRYTHPEQLENPDLFKRNCLDILNADNYSSPLLNAIARHQLDLLATQTLDAEDVPDEIKHEETQKRSIAQSRRKKTSKASSQATSKSTSTQDDITLWEQICSEYAVRAVDFYTIFEDLDLDQGPTDAVANMLYDAITDPDRQLLVDEYNTDVFHSLYRFVAVNYFRQQEKQILEAWINEQTLAGNHHAAAPDDKLMVKSLAMLRGILRYDTYLKYNQKAELYNILGCIYVTLHSLNPKPAFREEGTTSFKRLQRLIDVLEGSEQDRWDDFNLQDALDKFKQTSSVDKRLHLAAQLPEAEKEQRDTAGTDIRTRTLTLDARYDAILKSAHHHTFIDEISWMLLVATSNDKVSVGKMYALTHQLEKPVDETNLYFFSHLHAMLELCLDFIDQEVEYSERQSQCLILERCYTYLLTAYAKVNNIAEEQTDHVEFGLRQNMDAPLPEAQSFVKNTLNSIRDRIDTLGGNSQTLPNIEEQKLEKPFLLPLEIPEALHKIDALKPVLDMLEDKKYWQMLTILKSRQLNSSEALFLNALLHTWLLSIIYTDDFKTFLGPNKAVQTSYAEATKCLEQQRLALLNKANKKSMKDLCKQEKKTKPTATEERTPFSSLSLFSTRTDGEDSLKDEKNPSSKLA